MSIEALPRIMLVDMNSFFASVEQQANPFLRGRPVGVGPALHEGSCLIGTSREAKALGIRNGISTYKARRIYPGVVVLRAEPQKYRVVSQAVNKIFLDYTDQVEPYSIDESFLDLSYLFRNSEFNSESSRRDSESSSGLRRILQIGAEIKRRIRAEVGEWLTCSVGIAPNKFLAKLAADLQKPDGLSIVWRSQLPEIYRHKKLTDLWGVARGWEKRLGKMGIISPAQLLDYPVANLIAMFGKPGFWLWQRVNGLEEFEIADNEAAPKSFGQSWVLNFRSTDKSQLKKVIMRLAEKAARRMRREGFVASGIYLSVALTDGNYFHRSQKLPFIVDTGLELYQQAMRIWAHWKFSAPAVHIAVGFNYLSPKVDQLSMFGQKTANLSPILDQINDKYGEFTIRSGLLTNTQDFAPDSIAFGK